VVRTKIKEFSQQKVKLPNDAHKIIILDEADSLTTAAQQALRMIISDFSETTRFVFACNDSSRIIEPIQSRCVILRFSKLSDREVTERLLEVIKQEHIQYDDEGLEAIVFSAEGDMRTAINNLQATAIGAGRVTREKVYLICDIPDIGKLKAIVEHCVKGNREGAFTGMRELWEESFTAFDLVNNIGKVIESLQLEIDLLYEFIDEVSSLKVRVLQGINSLLQLLAFLSRLADIADGYRNKKK
jgi:replication factor C subunit 2/4